jgi:two-component system sensor histidine kinase UhpB
MHASLPIEVAADDVGHVSGELASELLAMTREALSNVVRHAAAGRADVSLERREAALHLEVSDDGQGFDAAAAVDPAHHGLANMRARASRVGGTLHVMSRQGLGTRIIVTVPLASETMGGGGTTKR